MCTVHAWTFLVLSGWVAAFPTFTLNEGCDTPGGNAGRCVLVEDCPFLRDLIPADQNYVDQFHCGEHYDDRSLVCCPELQNEQNCGRINLKNNIIGGDETDIDEYPWMAVLAYWASEGNDIIYNCGGTLIGEKFVVTAAHCVSNLSKDVQLTLVRLGEWDFTTKLDCNHKRCNKDPHTDFSIAKIIKHEKYNAQSKNGEHDIALLKLHRKVLNTDTISTICLPSVEMMNSLDVEHESFDVAGWGVTKAGETRLHSKRKIKVTLKGRSLNVCNAAYFTSNVTFTENHLCVGGVDGKDACRGDSGGPLMILKHNRWHLAGVVSVGSPQCGHIGIPGIYTNIGRYLDWLAGKIELESP